MDPLKKIKSMTTDIGIYQHGKLNKPNPEFGYALEDQARALIVAEEFKNENLQEIYLNFILKAQKKDGLLHHFYFENKNKGLWKNDEYTDKPNAQEAHGITLWSLMSLKNNQNDDVKKIIKNLIADAYNWTSPRAMAAALLGLVNYKHSHSLENELKLKLHNYYFATNTENWEWFENYLMYANAIIPWSLWEIYLKRKCKKSFEIAKKTTEFLMNNCQENNIPSPVGNRGWYIKGENKALFDQQPIDPGYMVCCLEKAHNATGSSTYLDWANKWYEWFWGNNINRTPLIDKDFACYDALTPEGVNLNQGAESNVCFLMAFLASKRLGLKPLNKKTI